VPRFPPSLTVNTSFGPPFQRAKVQLTLETLRGKHPPYAKGPISLVTDFMGRVYIWTKQQRISHHIITILINHTRKVVKLRHYRHVPVRACVRACARARACVCVCVCVCVCEDICVCTYMCVRLRVCVGVCVFLLHIRTIGEWRVCVWVCACFFFIFAR
jgi:hypothetical protein